MIKSFKEKTPQLGDGAFVADSALVMGDVVLGYNSSVWYGAVLRGDVHSIRVGDGTNIQDLSVVHVTRKRNPAIIGDQVTVGHRAVIHGCTVGDRCLVGIGAILLDGVELGESCVVAAGSLLPPGKVYPPRSLVVGSPGRIKGQVSDEELEWILDSARQYELLAQAHAGQERSSRNCGGDS